MKTLMAAVAIAIAIAIVMLLFGVVAVAVAFVGINKITAYDEYEECI